TYVLAYSDLTTGENLLVTLPKDAELLANELMNLNVRELIVSTQFHQRVLRNHLESRPMTLSVADDINIPQFYRNLVAEIYEKSLLEAFGRLINYLLKTKKRELMHLQKVQVFESSQYLRIDNNSKRNLELTETYRSQNKKGSLFGLLDVCGTAMGSRYLKQTILRPLIDKNRIESRYSLVEDLNDDFIAREEIESLLKQVYDLERIIGRISFGNANAKDLINLSRSLKVMPQVREIVESIHNDYGCELVSKFSDLGDLCQLIDSAIIENPPLSIKEGGIIKPGYSTELDEIKSNHFDAKQWIEKFESDERERTGIKKLRIGYNRVFGYYIEVTKSQIELVKPEFGYERKQTLSNSERYITEELKAKEMLILGSEESQIQLEYELFVVIRDRCREQIEAMQTLARVIAEIDMLTAFSSVSIQNRYVRPELNQFRSVDVIGGRHAVVESLLEKGTFVENDLHMGDNTSILLITGPNMSGKSTYMRQLALIVIMAQMGCFVPATSVNLPVFDQIFTRIGASDDLSTGKSTFMIEMLEVNYALQNATSNSLILFDEIGRGTATYDGMALAQAIIEYTHHKLTCKTLFSTHYHELTFLEDDLKSLHNVHVRAKEEKGSIVFLHKVADGPTDRSYGIHVAKLAKLPLSLIRRSQAILETLEKNHGYNVIKPQTIDLFNYEIAEVEDEIENEKYESILEQLKEIDINDLTPLKAMNILAETVEAIKKLK
ncbi:MAG: DNA mismatch repair protein MutS, partial [Bacilli bacterium]|nr:DNA mismatch repair protein MutS [Bacilli bacterium]